MGDARHPLSLERRNLIFPSRGSIRSPASPARPIPGRRRGPATAVLLHRPPGDPLRQNGPSYSTPFYSSSATTPRRPASGQARLSEERRPRPTAGGRLRRPIPGPRAVPEVFQTSSRRQGGYILHFEVKTLPLPTRRAGCAAAQARPAAGRHGATSQTRVINPTHNTATTSAKAAPRHLQLPSRRSTCSAASTAALPPFRPPSPQRRTPETLHPQPHTPTASSAWGGAVERRHLMAALSISSVFISYILITQPLVYCLRKKCKIYYSLYCTTTCIISRDESLNSVDYKGLYNREIHSINPLVYCGVLKKLGVGMKCTNTVCIYSKGKAWGSDFSV